MLELTPAASCHVDLVGKGVVPVCDGTKGAPLIGISTGEPVVVVGVLEVDAALTIEVAKFDETLGAEAEDEVEVRGEEVDIVSPWENVERTESASIDEVYMLLCVVKGRARNENGRQEESER